MGNKMEKDEQVYYAYEQGTNTIKIELENKDSDSPVIKPPKKTSKKAIILIAVLVALVAVAGVFLFRYEKNRREENTFVITEDCIQVICRAIDGKVKILAGFSGDEFKNRANEVFSGRVQAEDNPDYIFEKTGILVSAISFLVQNEEAVLEGEQAVVKVEVDEGILKELGVYVKAGTFTVDVVIDDEVKVLLEKADPLASVIIYEFEYEDEIKYIPVYPAYEKYEIEENDFEVEVMDDSKDKVKVKIKNTAVSYLENIWGVAFERTERIYTENEIIHKYVSDYDDLSEAMIDECKENAKRDIKALYTSYNKSLVIDSMEYYGGWIVTYDSTQIINMVTGIYEIQVSHKENLFEPITLYIKHENFNVYVNTQQGFMETEKTRVDDNVRTLISIGEDTANVHGANDVDSVWNREILSLEDGDVVFDESGNVGNFLNN